MVILATQKLRAQTQPATKTTGFPAESELKDLRFKLTFKLQSTLDLHVALEVFFENIQSVVSCDGIIYNNETLGIHCKLGTGTQHSAQYTVASAQHSLGELTFRRSKRFIEAELAILEMLIGVLFYPLRNALLYKEALENSQRDTLTGIGNRGAMDISFGREIKLAKRQNQPLSVLVIDIDHFKNINDHFGHKNGDKALAHISMCIQQSLRETDQIFRYGGEEFVALLNGTRMNCAKLTAERIRINVASSSIDDVFGDTTCTVSIGVSSLSMSDDAESLFERADAALYQAKREGRNKVICSIKDKRHEIQASSNSQQNGKA